VRLNFLSDRAGGRIGGLGHRLQKNTNLVICRPGNLVIWESS
jgi:hypothetical protein